MDSLAISIAANVVLGLILLGVLYRERGSDSERLTEPEQALARYRIHYPSARGRVFLAADGRAALLELTDGSLGLVERRGRRWNARALEPADIVGVDRMGDRSLTVRLADFGWPRARIQLSDAEICRSWMERLGGVMREAAGPERGSGVRRA